MEKNKGLRQRKWVSDLKKKQKVTWKNYKY